MYSRKESSQIRQQFWTAFGQYMNPIPSADGETINWINYRTGEKYIHFRMQADRRHASIAIELSHPDADTQAHYFRHFQRLKSILTATLPEEWKWELQHRDEHGKLVSRIYTGLDGVNVLNASDWPALISFFKPRLIALDEFWSQVRETFKFQM